MRSSGFTLVELLAVISILTLLGLIIVPITSKVLSDNKNKLYNIQIKNIEDGARNYVSSHVFDLDIPVGSSKGITLSSLQSLGFVETDIVNPLTRQKFSGDLVIVISNTSKGFIYKVCTENAGCDVVDML